MLNQEEYFSDCVRHAEGGTVVLVRSTDWKVACSSPTQRMYFVYNYCLAGARHGYDYEYHISGAVKSAVAYVLDNATSGSNGGSSGGVLNESTTAASSVPKVLYSETLYYEDCDSEGCTPQYNGNISRMVHKLAHINQFFSTERDVAYYYDELNRLTKVDDKNERDFYDEAFTYDAQGRITSQRRDGYVNNATGGEYSYYAQSNRLEKVSAGMSSDVDFNRNMTSNENFIYDRDGNMIENKSKKMIVKYNHRNLPTEFKREVLSNENGADSVRLILKYDGAGSRITKIRERKSAGETSWTMELATHYTGIGSEIREDALNNATKVVVNLPQGLGRYDIASASEPFSSESSANTVPSFEWYLKNHLGSTMLVYGTQSISDPTVANMGSLKAAYDYRAFGEQVDLTWPTNKVTETFTGKEKDDETELSYFGARYLDQMLGMWVSVDAKREYPSPFTYVGNNPLSFIDKDGNVTVGVQVRADATYNSFFAATGGFTFSLMFDFDRLKNRENPFLYSVSTDVGGKFSTSPGASISAGAFINADSPSIGSYVTPRVDVTAVVGMGLQISITPSNESVGRYDASVSVGAGLEGSIGGGFEAGYIDEFSFPSFFDSQLNNKMETDYTGSNDD